MLLQLGLACMRIFQVLPGTARVTKVKDHADEEMVLLGQVCEDDRMESDFADEAADF